ncbi:RNA polymerase sigma factor [Puniceicoccaceae bacterium K14]|nr:RNA polymerase sigma factor [Puniceicoccaceae bacterium K14]
MLRNKTSETIEKTVREEWSQTLSALVYRIHDFQLAEDALQDAILSAWNSWPYSGIPKNPRAWLLQVAKRKAIDQIRRKESFAKKQSSIALLSELEQEQGEHRTDMEIPDERLRMIFTCCHPAIDKRSSVALTLRTVAGLETREIAKAFLTEESAMGQRLTRVKRKIRDAGIPYRVPPPHLWQERLEAVLSVLYFIFNEGYLASSGDGLLRSNLCLEAIRLARVLSKLSPDEPEVDGLLALMLLHDSRRPARTNKAGAMISLEDQDRSLWIRENIEEGDTILRRILPKRRIGPYQIQAAVSAVHAHAPDWKSTDWPQIAQLYRTLYQYSPSSVVRLNEAVAISMIQGPQAGLKLLQELEEQGTLEKYQPFYAAKADLLRQLNRYDEAERAYEIAISKSANPAEKDILRKRLQHLKKN